MVWDVFIFYLCKILPRKVENRILYYIATISWLFFLTSSLAFLVQVVFMKSLYPIFGYAHHFPICFLSFDLYLPCGDFLVSKCIEFLGRLCPVLYWEASPAEPLGTCFQVNMLQSQSSCLQWSYQKQCTFWQ